MIYGIVVMASPERIGPVLKGLIASGFCEIHCYDGQGRILVTIESNNTEEKKDKMNNIQAIPYVISVSRAYALLKKTPGI